MSISKRLRFEILRRDNHACRYCGATAPDVKLTVDHVVPVALGGKDDPSNLVAACAGCNSGKSSSNADQRIVDDVSERALMWRSALEQAWDEWRDEKEELRAHTTRWIVAWTDWGWEDSRGERHSVPCHDDWRAAVERWLSVGFTIDELLDLIPAAMGRKKVTFDNKWAYYCGIVWRTLDKIEAATAAIAAKNEDKAPLPPLPVIEEDDDHPLGAALNAVLAPLRVP